jgi:hypothetical protein
MFWKPIVVTAPAGAAMRPAAMAMAAAPAASLGNSTILTPLIDERMNRPSADSPHLPKMVRHRQVIFKFHVTVKLMRQLSIESMNCA